MVLSDNHISDSSAMAFASLGTSNTIECLDLDLDENRLGDGMARTLAVAVNLAHAIRTVRLSLEYGFVGDDGARALSTIMYIPWVSSVDLSLRFNQIGPVGKHALLGDEQLKVAGQNRTVKVEVP